MDLLQVIISEIKDFYVLLKNNEEIPIKRYAHIDIDFCDRIAIIDEKSVTFQEPMITYYVEMDTKSKDRLRIIFEDCYYGTEACIQTRRTRIRVGEMRYVFGVELTARPDMNVNPFQPDVNKNSIKICLKLENTNISMFDRASTAYEKYTRFEILDL